VTRNSDDDAPRRIRDADELIYARLREADEPINVMTTNLVIDTQERLARHRRLDHAWRAGWAVSWLSLLTAVIRGVSRLEQSGGSMGRGEGEVPSYCRDSIDGSVSAEPSGR
jgi:hypothetical protein